MQGEMTIIRTDGSSQTIPYNKKVPYEHINKAVGGYIEAVPRFTRYDGKDCVAFCNEEGKLQGLANNEAATRLWIDQCPLVQGVDHLVGDIVIFTGDVAFMRSL